MIATLIIAAACSCQCQCAAPSKPPAAIKNFWVMPDDSSYLKLYHPLPDSEAIAPSGWAEDDHVTGTKAGVVVRQ